ncbi:hypothetical protein L2E82_26344 [Cichorium intybus]|uniref:Uncharacterized protein n=1 Tax=Cichorium intybus TaxID=13427 RepID=A0ACB9CQA3_CICIN|nr:hypothetical protein L2E82_26344 [Cichorium intybus]
MAGDAGEKSGNKDGASGVDSNSPYYLHASDYPRQMQVNDVLTDTNYGDWSQEMKNFLFAKNKMGFVNGTIKKPEENSDEYMMWMRCDAMIKGWLTTAMEKNIRSSVKYANTSAEMWVDLEERFGKESAPRAYELKRTLTVTQQDGASVSAYYTKMRGIWDEIQSVSPSPHCTCGKCACDIGKRLNESKEKERLYEFLLGLDDVFSTVRTQILTSKPTPTLGTAYHLVAEDEQQRAIAATRRPVHDASAFQSFTKRETPNDAQRNKGYSKEAKRSNQEMEQCTFCGKGGHNKEGCFKRIGYPEWWPGKGKKEKDNPKAALVNTDSSPVPGLTNEQYQMFVKHFSGTNIGETKSNDPNVNMAGKSNKNKPWVVDSGATEHMTNDRSLLKNTLNCDHELPVTIPNGDSIPVKGKGDSALPNGIEIRGVLYIPKFKCNLLSVGRLTDDLNCAVTFFPGFCVAQELETKNLIGVGKRNGGLYRMDSAAEIRKAMLVAPDVGVWHRRLGHASEPKLQRIDFLKSFTYALKNKTCDSCVKAKHTRLSFPSSSIKTVECFDLLHCDIWGSYRTPSLSGARYFLTIVDDFSRNVWVYLIKHKHEASNSLVTFCNMVKTQFGKKVKRVRSDNGGEFTSSYMNDFYASEGIILETSCVHTPQQNGVVERKHRHLLEVARALRFEAMLPIKFWGECVLTAAYIINRLPSKVIGFRTPFEILFKQKPDYESMRVFGCRAYSRNTETKGDKFEMKGRPGAFIGYPYAQKGYKIYDFDSNKIIVSRDVKFVEHSFPFAESNCRQQENENGEFFDSHRYDESPDIVNNQINEEANNEIPETFNNQGDEGVTDQSQSTEIEQQSNVNNEPPDQNLCNQRERRTRVQPKRLEDFVVKLPPSVDNAQPTHNQVDSTVHPLSNYVTYDNFSQQHKAFLSAISSIEEPKCFKQAAQNDLWREAMQREIKALEENGTWTLAELPAGKRAVDSKWVYNVKYKPNGEVERYKARLVAKGFTQMEVVDFHDTFAPVAKLVTVRTLLAIAAKKDWIIHQLDVNNAFLHGDLHEEVYMKIPEGFAKEGDSRVCRLKKSLYGLRQASCNWYQKFTTTLTRLNFKQTHADASLFIYKQGDTFVAALIYVDDVIITGNDIAIIRDTKDHLDKQFSIKDLGPLKYFLGIEVAKTSEGIVLSQRKYTLDILEDTGMTGCRPSSFPMEQNLQLGQCDDSPRVDASQYRRLVGRLLYLQATRPDIAYAVNMLSQFVSDPKEEHMNAAIRVLRYLKTTPGQGILIPKGGDLELMAYCDSDWLGCSLTRRSRTGYLLLLGGAPISWKTKKQNVVSRSSAEAEYRAMAITVSEVLWVRWLLRILQAPQSGPTPLFCDNQAARHIANNPVFHERTKHVEMDCYFVRERVETQEIKPLKIDTKLQVADIFTKALGAEQLRNLLGKLGIRNLHAPT